MPMNMASSVFMSVLMSVAMAITVILAMMATVTMAMIVPAMRTVSVSMMVVDVCFSIDRVNDSVCLSNGCKGGHSDQR